MRSVADQYLDWFGETGANLLISAPRVLHRLKAVPSHGCCLRGFGRFHKAGEEYGEDSSAVSRGGSAADPD